MNKEINMDDAYFHEFFYLGVRINRLEVYSAKTDNELCTQCIPKLNGILMMSRDFGMLRVLLDTMEGQITWEFNNEKHGFNLNDYLLPKLDAKTLDDMRAAVAVVELKTQGAQVH